MLRIMFVLVFIAFALFVYGSTLLVMLSLGWLMRGADLNLFLFTVICLVCMATWLAQRRDRRPRRGGRRWQSD